jgi:hypothetical protein
MAAEARALFDDAGDDAPRGSSTGGKAPATAQVVKNAPRNGPPCGLPPRPTLLDGELALFRLHGW